MTNTPLVPGTWLGLLGGGQLGRMFAMASQSLGYRVAVLDPEAEGPASAVADLHIVKDYDDPAGLQELAGFCAAVTTEFENVPAYSLSWLAERVLVSPKAESVAIAQDRGSEKSFIAAAGLAVTPHALIESAADLDHLPASFWPGILKVRRLGYDGKGQVRVADPAAARLAFESLGSVPSVLEERLELAFEISIVVARAFTGEAKTYPVARNIHRDGILAISIVDDPTVSADLALRARDWALTIAQRLDYVGILCVEFFVQKDGQLVVNEIAPRPHNSGHYTIDACVTSQFEQQARVLAGLPLGSPRQHSATLMLNLLGDLWFPGGDTRPNALAREPDWAGVLKEAGAKLHLYGKRHARVGRKMGHVTFVAETLTEAQAQARRVAACLGIAPW